MRSVFFLLKTLVTAILMSALASCQPNTENAVLTTIIESSSKHSKIPILSIMYPDLNLDTAYEVQKKLVALQAETASISGYKAGMTSRVARRKFKIDEAIMGVLFAKGQVNNGSTLTIPRENHAVIETEIGFILKEDINKQVNSLVEFKQKLKGIVAVIEFPDMNFESLEGLKGTDIIAINAASGQYLISKPINFEDINLNKLTVILYKDNSPIYRGHSWEIMGDQWKAAMWLTNSAISHGYPLRAGHILITGPIGGMVKATQGEYRVSYSDLGELSFTIK